MSRFVEGEDRHQAALLPSCLDDYIGEDNPARVVDVFVDEFDLGGLGFEVTPAATGRQAYYPAMLLKLYIYGYLNRTPSSRRLEREAGRNVELRWLASSGCQWRALPKDFPPYSTVQGYFYDWSRGRVFAAINHALIMASREKIGREAIRLLTRRLARV